MQAGRFGDMTSFEDLQTKTYKKREGAQEPVNSS